MFWEFSPSVAFAFLLTLFAGLSTGVGSLLALLSSRTNKRFLSVALGFSAGVMIYIAMVEILIDAQKRLVAELGKGTGAWMAIAAFFGGMALAALIDKLVPSAGNPHEPKNIQPTLSCGETASPCAADNSDENTLMRMGLLTALAIAVHNFPEGLATFAAALKDPGIGVSIAIAVAIHNIPEGIAVSVPIYHATGDRMRAFRLSFLSGLSEPLGALFGYMFLAPFLSNTMFGLLFAAIAGIMVFISIDELLPGAQKYGEHHLSVYGFVAGMLIISISLVLF